MKSLQQIYIMFISITALFKRWAANNHPFYHSVHFSPPDLDGLHIDHVLVLPENKQKQTSSLTLLQAEIRVSRVSALTFFTSVLFKKERRLNNHIHFCTHSFHSPEPARPADVALSELGSPLTQQRAALRTHPECVV